MRVQLRSHCSAALAALGMAVALSGCANVDFDSQQAWFAKPFQLVSQTGGYTFSELAETKQRQRPITANDLVDNNGACPAPAAPQPRHPDPPAPAARTDKPPVTRPEHHPAPARRAARTREPHVPAQLRIHLDRQRARPYHDHRRSPPQIPPRARQPNQARGDLSHATGTAKSCPGGSRRRQRQSPKSTAGHQAAMVKQSGRQQLLAEREQLF